jgi:hypothetical protein
MKRSVLLSVLLAALVLVMPALMLVGCESLGETGETLAAETPAGENPDAENPDTEDPASETPASENPDAGTPATEPPATEHPAVEHPGGTPAAKTTTTASWNAGAQTLGTVAAILRYEAADPRLVWTTGWTFFTAATMYSGSEVAETNTANASVTIKFSGTSLGWIGLMGPDCGRAKVTLDGGNPSTVDLYSANYQFQKTVWQSGNLVWGSHTVKIECAWTASPSGSGNSVSVDAFDIAGTLE